MKQNSCRQYLSLSALSIVLSVSTLPVFALESDAKQAITIDSNGASYDEKSQLSTYTGNVVATQGSIRVNSDKLVVHLKDGEAEKLVFTGKMAKFKQTPSPGAKDITGQAETGEFYPKRNLLVLINNATIWQGNGTYSSDFIEYDIKTSLVKAGDKNNDESNSGKQRVHVVIQPKP
ncbi:MAG TPA: lipopolysaccharide transport periplasmic protein LptA [Methylococcaceae bacterium]|nr:lipopolysaccharide transport periplasmic protein LptA [Methylococcaceae bacterium]